MKTFRTIWLAGVLAGAGPALGGGFGGDLLVSNVPGYDFGQGNNVPAGSIDFLVIDPGALFVIGLGPTDPTRPRLPEPRQLRVAESSKQVRAWLRNERERALGSLILSPAKAGSFTAQLRVGGTTYRLRGAWDANGEWRITTGRGPTAWAVHLRWTADAAGVGTTLAGTVRRGKMVLQLSE